MKRNIIIFIRTLERAGSEKQAVLLSNVLSEKYSVFLVVFSKNKTSKYLKSLLSKKVNIFFLKGSLFNKIIQLFNIMKNKSPFIIFNYLLFANFLGGFLSLLFKKSRSIGGIRNSFIEGKKLPLNRFLVNYVNDYTIFNTLKGMNYYLKKGFSSDKVLFIPNSINLIINKKRNNNECIKILSVGRFHKQKDYKTALKVINNLKNKNFKLIYTIVGYGKLENEINSYIDYFGLRKIVKLLIKPNDINKIYSNSDIFFQTSLYEGISNTILESMSFSLPIICTNAGDNEYFIKNDYNGYITKPKDVESLTKYIKILIENKKKRIEFGHNNFKKVSKDFSLKKMFYNYEKFINKIE